MSAMNPDMARKAQPGSGLLPLGPVLARPAVVMSGAARRGYGLAAAVLWLGAGLLRWWVAPALELLPDHYVAETQYLATLRTHQTPSSPVGEFATRVVRRDQTLTSSADTSVIQGNANWLTPEGAPIFETVNTYGVDRRTRQNVAGLGDTDRPGQYLFPAHTLKDRYRFWNPLYGGPWAAGFSHTAQFHGIEVYVFNARADGIDETAGYSALPDVPEKYRALTYGEGRLLVEPVSGLVVDQQDTGTSYFVDPKTGEHVGEPINQWTARLTEQTVEAQLRLAATTRRRMLLLEAWLPFALAAAGLFAAEFCLVRRVEP